MPKGFYARPSLLDRVVRCTVLVGACWEWMGVRSTGGYGRVGINGKSRAAHRVVYEALIGAIPEGLTLDHLCRNRACVNPNHLEPVTMRINTLRGLGVTAVHHNKTHCIRGHAFAEYGGFTGPANPGRYCRKCVAAVRQIRQAALSPEAREAQRAKWRIWRAGRRRRAFDEDLKAAATALVANDGAELPEALLSASNGNTPETGGLVSQPQLVEAK